MPADTSNSGIYVVEGPARGQAIPVDGESVTAFVGPTPRGPVDHAVTVKDLDDFTAAFGAPDFRCRMEFALAQFFANGGRNAAVVRVSSTALRARIRIPAGNEELVLEARNPGPLEYLRASVDYDGIDAEDIYSFNLIVQRLRAKGSAWIDAQECYRRVSIDAGSRDYLGYLLDQSDLVRLAGSSPSVRPDETIKSLTMKQAGYVDTTAGAIDNPPPSDYDLIGSAARGTGLAALEHLADIGQVVLLPGSEGAALGPVALLAADRFCRNHQAMLIIDPPARWQTAETVIRDQQRSGFASPNAITWFPGVRIRNQQGERVSTTAAGAIAAALVAGDRNDGVLQLHSGDPVMLRSGMRPGARLDDADIARLRRVGVNALVQRSALHLQLMGNVTQSRFGTMGGDCQELHVRRRALFILRRIRAATRWTFFNDSNADTWAELAEQISGFLAELHDRGMLAGDTHADAFFVKCDQETNARSKGELGRVGFIVGFALQRPGDFLAYRFQLARGTCRIAPAAWRSEVERAG